MRTGCIVPGVEFCLMPELMNTRIWSTGKDLPSKWLGKTDLWVTMPDSLKPSVTLKTTFPRLLGIWSVHFLPLLPFAVNVTITEIICVNCGGKYKYAAERRKAPWHPPLSHCSWSDVLSFSCESIDDSCRYATCITYIHQNCFLSFYST